MSDKIKPTHLERGAIVYVRQSSMHQVREHLESQRRQYELVDSTKRLGFRKVVTIDDDLGRSAAGTQERPGFDRLVAAVCRGQAGAVVALEASRLARNNREWHHLIDFCGLTDTLVIDHDGIYDPGLVNDRLLLGLKGTMSEFELSLMRQRAHEALRAKIRRGEVLWELPVAYVRTDDNGVEMTPDRQVQEAVRSVFSKFQEYGSARQVLLWFRQHGIPLPVSRHHTPRPAGPPRPAPPACFSRSPDPAGPSPHALFSLVCLSHCAAWANLKPNCGCHVEVHEQLSPVRRGELGQA